jgi:hypothetical protein
VVRITTARSRGRGLEAARGGRDGTDSASCDGGNAVRERGFGAHTYVKREGEEHERPDPSVF